MAHPPPPVTQPLLNLYTFDKNSKRYSISPFATKLRFALRHAGILYEDHVGNFRDPPKKKIPYVKFVESGEFMGDTALIIQRLTQEGKMRDTRAALSPEQKAMDLCLRTIVEDRMYFLSLYERWHLNRAGMKQQEPFINMNTITRTIFHQLFYRHASLMLYFQGTGRHAKDEVVRFIEETMEAIGDFADASMAKTSAGSRDPFWILGGSDATEADFAVYGHLAMFLQIKVNPIHARLIRDKPALVEYITRIHNRYFSDIEDVL